MGRIITTVSGCGGVGKTTVALSVAAGAAKRGVNTILLDASGAARSCDLMLGLENIVVLDMLDVIKRQVSVQDALYVVLGKKNFRFACASLYEGVTIAELSGILLALRAMCDLLVIDLPTGSFQIDPKLLDADDLVLFVTRPDDISLRSLERIMRNMPRDVRTGLVVNRYNPHQVKCGVQYSVQVVETLMDMPADGCISESESIPAGMKKGKTAGEAGLQTASEIKKLLDRVL